MVAIRGKAEYAELSRIYAARRGADRRYYLMSRLADADTGNTGSAANNRSFADVRPMSLLRATGTRFAEIELLCF